MMQPSTYRIAVVGATGVVGRTITDVLMERGFPVGEYVPMASGSPAHGHVEVLGKARRVLNVDETDFDDLDVAFFTAGAAVSRRHVPRAVEKGCRVIDNTTAFRMDESVPLVVPEINGSLVRPDTMLVACPNCTAIVLVMSLAPVHRTVPVERVVVTSFQSVSGAGRNALDELESQIRADHSGGGIRASALPKQIAFNCLPWIGDIRASGYTTEEEKIIEETRKILGPPWVDVVPTAVRVPTRVGHALAVNLELAEPLTTTDLVELWQSAPGVAYSDDVPTPLDIAGTDTVVIGRLRRDPTRPHAVSYWVVGDNLRKGAATNSVQIAELICR